VYIGLLAAFGLMGVLIPQVPEAMRGNEAAVQAWLDTKRDTFGPLTDLMYRLGLFSVFQARWFLFALGFLVLFVTTCTLNRWSPTFRNVFRPPVRVPDSFYVRAHNRTELAPVAAADVEHELRGMRFGRVETEVRDGATHIFADRFPWTQLSTFISHLALILFRASPPTASPAKARPSPCSPSVTRARSRCASMMRSASSATQAMRSTSART
jgi:cytochrome c biogenesis protein ResB